MSKLIGTSDEDLASYMEGVCPWDKVRADRIRGEAECPVCHVRWRGVGTEGDEFLAQDFTHMAYADYGRMLSHVRDSLVT